LGGQGIVIAYMVAEEGLHIGSQLRACMADNSVQRYRGGKEGTLAFLYISHALRRLAID